MHEYLDNERYIELLSITKSYIIVFKTILKLRLSNAKGLIDDGLPGLENILNEIKNRRLKDVDDLHHQYGILKRLINNYDSYFLSKEVNDKYFRQLSILPQVSDFEDCEGSDLPINKADGPYDSVNHYLSVHFHQTRENMLRDFRDCVKKHRNSSFHTYENVSVICPPTYSPEGIFYTITITASKAVDWSKQFLLPGTMICFMEDSYESLTFAVITKPKVIENGSFEIEIKIKIDDACDDIFDGNVDYLMFEISADFEGYKHILNAIKEFDEMSFPLSDFLVYSDFQESEPDYLIKLDDPKYCCHKKCGGSREDLKNRMIVSLEQKNLQKLPSCSAYKTSRSVGNEISLKDTKQEYKISQTIDSCNCKQFDPLDYNDWPVAPELEMDHHQMEAFQMALTKKVSVIQGYPGSGKTFIGVKIVKTILQNLEISPIVVCCSSDHELDLFLEHISKLTKKIVRLGNKSQSNIARSHALDNLVTAYNFQLNKCKNRTIEIDYFQKESLNHLKLLVPKLLKCKPAQNSSHQFKEITRVSKEINDFDDICYLVKKEYLTGSALNEIICVKDRNELLSGSKTNSPFLLTSVLEWLCCSRNTALYEACESRFKKLKNFSIIDSVPNFNLWTLSLNKRFELFFVWREKCLSTINNKMREARDKYQKLKTSFNERVEPVKQNILKSSHVIGVTSSDAAKNRILLKSASPNILIVEEAETLLESHVISMLLPTTQHLIFIRDHKQVKPPTPANTELNDVDNLKLSMSERLLRNGAPSAILTMQHRMKPCLADLLAQQEFYPCLKSHKSVHYYEKIKGFKSSMFFLDHNKPEKLVCSGTSFINDYEANMIVLIVKYLTLMSYFEEQITILTFHAAQALLIKKYLDEEKLSVFVTTVENFRGKENDVVLISFVRSNTSGLLGFLYENRRIGIALSRARKGLFCIGNFSFYSSCSASWNNIVEKLKSKENIGPAISLTCFKHKKDIFAKSPENIRELIKDGCGEVCGYNLPCGHISPGKCHYDYQDHSEHFKCHLPCDKYILETKKLPNVCFEACKEAKTTVMNSSTVLCVVNVTKLLTCNHEVIIPRGTNLSSYKCEELVETVLPCSHKSYVPCFKTTRMNDLVCNEVIPRVSSCGHTITVPCSLNLQPDELLAFCEKTCDQLLTCGHACKGKCRWCFDMGIHAQCKENCEKKLECGHLCSGYCESPCLPCNKNCSSSCLHNAVCSNRCYDPCRPCEKMCKRKCKHSSCINKCSEPCSVPPCLLHCSLRLQCGHKCIGLCGDPCPSLCRVCNEEDLTLEHSMSATYVQLVDCGHIIKSDSLLEHIEDALESFVWPDCPECKTPIQRSLRYKDKLMKAKENVLSLNDYSKEIESIIRSVNSMETRNTILPLEFRGVHQKVTDILRESRPRSGPLLVLQHCLTVILDLIQVSKNFKETCQQNVILHSRFEKLLLWVHNNLTCASYQQLNEVSKEVEFLKNSVYLSN
ncbi:hypothetical protein JTE90_009599 [Oedothorax gibbosus]|uniref:NFX1-type zinc finger-containing protein 1 n=1 Tax=Oedothorax gibbosus TaxID=931172 RepID=A0AAV6VID0_9ARAC|nr:hypothetical protein JTE90_009599 [Oedothorax gibbosus]